MDSQFDALAHFADVQARLAINTHCWCLDPSCPKAHLRDGPTLASLLKAIILTFVDRAVGGEHVARVETEALREALRDG
jgi:hypothetical protein